MVGEQPKLRLYAMIFALQTSAIPEGCNLLGRSIMEILIQSGPKPARFGGPWFVDQGTIVYPVSTAKSSSRIASIPCYREGGKLEPRWRFD